MTLQELNNLPPDEREEAERGADAAEQADQERADRIAARQREEAEEAVAEAQFRAAEERRERINQGRDAILAERAARRGREGAANCTNAG